MAAHGGDDVSDPVIEVIDASVSYMIRHGASPTLKETIIQSFKRESHDVEVKAMQNMSLTDWRANILMSKFSQIRNTRKKKGSCC